VAVLPRELLVKGAAVMAEDNDVLGIGGAIDLETSLMFTSAPGLYQVVSSDAGDIAVGVELTFRDAVNRIQSEARVMQGLTPVPFSQGMFRLLKGVKSGASLGVVAVERQATSFFDFADSGGGDEIVLPVGAPAVSGALIGQVCRITEGLAAGEIAQVIEYDGATRTLYLSRDVGSIDGTSKVRVAPGMVFHVDPIQETTVTRLLYGVPPARAGGGQRTFFGKMFFYNGGSDPLEFPRIVELFDVPGRFRYGLDADGVDGTSTNGATKNRLQAPAGVTFVNGETFLDEATLDPGSAIGIWVEETVEEDALLDDYLYQLLIAGD
jgi:hypothetical protein